MSKPYIMLVMLMHGLLAACVAQGHLLDPKSNTLVIYDLSPALVTLPSQGPAEVPGAAAVYVTNVGSTINGPIIGGADWTGTYTSGPSVIGTSWLVVIKLTSGARTGSIICAGNGGGTYSPGPNSYTIIGGDGDFKGASGTLVWVAVNDGITGKYTFTFDGPLASLLG